jgi:DNA-directed RNA polymerase subunit RPC12/RpoP
VRWSTFLKLFSRLQKDRSQRCPDSGSRLLSTEREDFRRRLVQLLIVARSVLTSPVPFLT